MSTRRQFIRHSCMAGAGLAMGSILIHSCVSHIVNITQVRPDELLVPVARFTTEKGKALNYLVIQTSTLPFSVALYKRGTDYSAYKLVCTHNRCDLSAQEEKMSCPCHGSEFDTGGKVLCGPANVNLKLLPAKEENGNVIIKLI